MSRSSRQFPQPKPSPRDTTSLATLPLSRTPSLQTRNFTQLLQRAQQHYQHQQMNQAINVLQRGLYYNPNNLQVNYLLAVTHISIGKYQEALKHIQIVHKNDSKYKNNIMMLLAITHKKLGQLQHALTANTEQIHQKQTSQALFYRAKIHIAMNHHHEALVDLERILSKQKHDPAALLQIKCLTTMKLYDQALQTVNTAKHTIQKVQKLQEIYREQVKIYALKKEYQKALSIFQQIDKIFPNLSPDTLLLKAKILQLQGKVQQSMMVYNELLAKNSTSRVFSQAIAQSAISCMRERDFYQAFAYLKRTILTKIRCKATDQLLKLAQGVTFLMKKKHAQAIVLMGSCLIDFQYSLTTHIPFLSNLLNNALAFANFSLANHQTALELYLKIIPNQPSTDSTAASYNIHICQGIIQYQLGNREQAIDKFEKATTCISRPQPYFYMAVILNQQYLQQPINTQGFVKILQLIEQGLRAGQNSHMYYYRSILYLYLGMNSQSLQDIDRAIQKSEDNVARYFYTRGIIFMLDKNYQQAIMQFSTALSIDEHDQDSIIDKAKCELISGDVESAFSNIQNTSRVQEIKILFMLYQKQYADIIDSGGGSEAIRQICYFMEGKFQQAGPSGKLILAILYQNYAEVIGLIEEAVGLGVPVGCLQANDLLILKAFSQFRLNKYEECLLTLQRVQIALRDTNSRSDTYSQEDERKLLLCKANVIIVNHKRNHKLQALGLTEELIAQVCEGPIFDQLQNLRMYFSSGGEHQVDFLFQAGLLSDYFASQTHEGLSYKFLIPLPNYRVTEVEMPQFQQLLTKFSVQDIDNKPEAPWILRGQYGVIFTNEIREFENLNLKTEQNEVRSRMPTGQQSRAINKNRSELIEYLKLSDSVLNKLDRIAKKREIQIEN